MEHYTKRLETVLDALKTNSENFDEYENDPVAEFGELYRMLKDALPTDREKQIEKLAHYISEDDVEAALDTLEAADDAGKSFDDADDHVLMWYPLEGMYTVSELLEQIG